MVLAGMTGHVQGTVELSANVRYADDVRAEVIGTDGALLVESYPKKRTLPGPPSGLHAAPDSDIEGKTFGAGIKCELAPFSDAVAGSTDRSTLPGPGESIRALVVGLAARVSLQRGEPVELTETLSVLVSAETALGPLPRPASAIAAA